MFLFHYDDFRNQILQQKLKVFESVKKSLQDDGIMISDVHTIFDLS